MFCVEAQKVIQRGANAGKLRRQCEDLAELAIPAHEVQVFVEYRNALSHMVERGLQDLAIVVGRDGLRFDLLPHRRHHMKGQEQRQRDDDLV